MTAQMALRYALELSMMIPAAFMAILPIWRYKRFTARFTAVLTAAMMIIFIAGGAVVCSWQNISSNMVLMPSIPIFFMVYHVCFDLEFFKKLYCFLMSAMLCGFCSMYSVFVTAPIELTNAHNVFHARSSGACLGISIIIAGSFFRTFACKLPELFEDDSTESMWVWLNIVPFIMTIICVWMTPTTPQTVMVRRVRVVSMVVFLLIPIAIWFFIHMQWRMAKNMAKTAEYRQSIDILKLEEKQYINTLRAFEETRTLRHDFRQHLLVINDLARKGDTEKLIEYISPFIETSSAAPKRIFENYPLNAVAGHYMELAKEQSIKILWNINVPENIPFKESDICALLGNLIENSINAVQKLPTARREVHIAIALKQGKLLIISVTNPYEGAIEFDKRGLPKSAETDHGIGLKSIMNTVKRYGGNMSLEAKDGIFEVGILMNVPD